MTDKSSMRPRERASGTTGPSVIFTCAELMGNNAARACVFGNAHMNAHMVASLQLGSTE